MTRSGFSVVLFRGHNRGSVAEGIEEKTKGSRQEESGNTSSEKPCMNLASIRAANTRRGSTAVMTRNGFSLSNFRVELWGHNRGSVAEGAEETNGSRREESGNHLIGEALHELSFCPSRKHEEGQHRRDDQSHLPAHAEGYGVARNKGCHILDQHPHLVAHRSPGSTHTGRW